MATEYLNVNGKLLMTNDGKLVSVPDQDGLNDLADVNNALATQSDNVTDEIEDLIINGVIDGSPKGVFADLNALQTAYPNGASGVYLTKDTGHWYYWDGSAWSDGGVYQTDLSYDEVKDYVSQLEENGYVNLITIPNYYSKESVASLTSDSITLNGSAWTGGVKYKYLVSPNTDYEIKYNVSRTSGVANIKIMNLSDSEIKSENISSSGSISFNSENNSSLFVYIRIGAVDCNNFVFSNISLIKKGKNIFDKINDKIENDNPLKYINYFDINNPISKTDDTTISGNSIILNSSAWVGNAVYGVEVKKNTNYVLRYNITYTSGVSEIDVGTTLGGYEIGAIKSYYRSAFTFNSGNNEKIYIKFRAANVDCVNYAYNNIRLNIVGNYSDTLIKKIGLKNTIVCWGDSLTAGAGSSDSIVIDGLKGATMPKALAHLLNYSIPYESSDFDGNEDNAVLNFGVGGETSATILCRMGAMQMLVNDITIPASGSVSFSKITCSDGQRVYPLHQNWSGSRWVFDTCYIGGIEGTLTYSGPEVETETNTGNYTFTRKTNGTELVINRPIAITSPIHERCGDILILQIGHNGGWNNDYNMLINQYKMAIEKSQTDRYIIIGNTSGDYESNKDWEYALQSAFQRHFINMREYLAHPIYDDNGNIISCYGLDDRGFTPTADDLTKISVGEVPRQLKVDSAHFTSYGYYTEAEQVYKRGKELGYW